jgi:hypothetical protein
VGYPAAMNSGIQVFAGSIYKVGVIRYVDVPREVSKKLGNAPHVPVTGTVEGVPVRTTLVSRGKGSYRMAIHSDIRKKLRVDCGAVVKIPRYHDRIAAADRALSDGREVAGDAGTPGEPVRGAVGAGKSHEESEGAKGKEIRKVATLEQTRICV